MSFDKYVDVLVEARKKKGINREVAIDQVRMALRAGLCGLNMCTNISMHTRTDIHAHTHTPHTQTRWPAPHPPLSSRTTSTPLAS